MVIPYKRLHPGKSLLIAALFLLPLQLFAQDILVLGARHGEHPLGNYIRILEDKEGKLTIHDVVKPEYRDSFVKSKNDPPNYGLSQSAYWARIVIDNRLHQKTDWMLELSYPVMDKVELYSSFESFPEDMLQPAGLGSSDKRSYIPRPDNIISLQMPEGLRKYIYRKSGDTEPFYSREIKHRNIIFGLQTQPGQREVVYIRFRSNGSIQLPLTLRDPSSFIAKDHEEQMMLGIYYGIMIVMMLYNFVVYLFLRDRNYLYYTLYILTFSLFLMAVNGLSFEYLWPSSPWWANKSVMFFAFLFLVWELAFTRGFLTTRQLTPRLDGLIRIMMGLGMMMTVLSLFMPYSLLIAIAIGLAWPFIGLTLVAAFRTHRKGYKPARYFIMAWMVYLGGLAIFLLKTLGFIPNNLFTQYGVQVGSALEVVLLSVALADRISTLKLQKEQAEREALNTEIYRLRNVELADALQKVQSLNQQLISSQEETDALNHELLETNRYLTELNEEKNEFLGIAAHDLQNPLAGIMMSSTMISEYYDRLPKEKIVDKANSIAATARRMREIVTDLLDINAIESGNKLMHPRELELVAFAREVYMEYIDRAAQKDISLIFRSDCEKLDVWADPQALHEVLDNLYSNAVKYSPHGKNIFITLSRYDGSARIAVRDEGPGLSEDDKTKLFRKFARLSAQPTAGESSTGLGLSIVKKLTEAMNGRIWCDSEAGQGATFTVELSLAHGE